MLSEHVTVETGDTKLSRRYSSTVQGHLRSLEQDEAKKYQNYIKAESVHLGMIDLNLFRVFDAMTQCAKGEPNTFGNSLSGQSRVEQAAPVNWRRALHPDRVRHATNATRCFSWPQVFEKDWRNWSGL